MKCKPQPEGDMYVCASNQNGSSWDSPPVVTPWVVQCPVIVMEFQEYYNEKCASRIIIVHEVYNNWNHTLK